MASVSSASSLQDIVETPQACIFKKQTASGIWVIAKNILNSRTVKITALTATVIICTLFLLSNPVGWVATAIGISLLATKILFSLVAVPVLLTLSGVYDKWQRRDFNQTLSMEITAAWYLLSERFRDNYNEIEFERLPWTGKGILFLGVAPNTLSDLSEKLERENINISAMLSLIDTVPAGTTPASRLNESVPHFIYQPYTLDDLNKQGEPIGGDPEHFENYRRISVRDHDPLTITELDQSADFIHEQIQAGKNVYVHCRDGVGRSSMAVAAYLIKYQGYKARKAALCVKESRSGATCGSPRKINSLIAFEASCRRRLLPSVTPEQTSQQEGPPPLRSGPLQGYKPLPESTFCVSHQDFKKFQNISRAIIHLLCCNKRKIPNPPSLQLELLIGIIKRENESYRLSTSALEYLMNAVNFYKAQTWQVDGVRKEQYNFYVEELNRILEKWKSSNQDQESQTSQFPDVEEETSSPSGSYSPIFSREIFNVKSKEEGLQPMQPILPTLQPRYLDDDWTIRRGHTTEKVGSSRPGRRGIPHFSSSYCKPKEKGSQPIRPRSPDDDWTIWVHPTEN